MERLTELLFFNNKKCAENLQNPVRSVIFYIFKPLEIKPLKIPQTELYSLCTQKNDNSAHNHSTNENQNITCVYSVTAE